MAFREILRKRFLELTEGSLRTEAPMSTKLKPQFFLKRLALLEALEEFFQHADHNRVDADAFGFGPLFELEPGLYADVEELWVGKLQTCLARLLYLHLFSVNLTESEKNNPG